MATNQNDATPARYSLRDRPPATKAVNQQPASSVESAPQPAKRKVETNNNNSAQPAPKKKKAKKSKSSKHELQEPAKPTFATLLKYRMTTYQKNLKSIHWPNNPISCHAKYDPRGLLHHPDYPTKQPISQEEIDLCALLSSQAEGVKGDAEIGMGSEGGDPMVAFFLVSSPGDRIANKISKALIRQCFGNTLHPALSIKIEKMHEKGQFWSDIDATAGLEEDMEPGDVRDEAYADNWSDTMTWFKSQEAFVDTVFVCVGEEGELEEMDESRLPVGVAWTPGYLPRLTVGLTEKGSLCGLFGFVVHT